MSIVVTGATGHLGRHVVEQLLEKVPAEQITAVVRDEAKGADAIAALRAEWAKLDAPMRLQGLAERHLGLKPLNATQYDQLKNLPERPPAFARPGAPDPIGAMINTIEAAADAPATTGSVPAPGDQQ